MRKYIFGLYFVFRKFKSSGTHWWKKVPTCSKWFVVKWGFHTAGKPLIHVGCFLSQSKHNLDTCILYWCKLPKKISRCMYNTITLTIIFTIELVQERITSRNLIRLRNHAMTLNLLQNQVVTRCPGVVWIPGR